MKLPAQWHTLAEREKNIVLLGGGLLIIILIYFLLISPFMDAISDLQNQLQTNRQIISWLQPAAQKIQRYNEQGYHLPKIDTGNFYDKINNSLQAAQLHSFITRITPVNDQQVAIVFNAVPFDAVMEWLTSLWLNTAAQVKQATIIRLNAPGLVSFTLILTLP